MKRCPTVTGEKSERKVLENTINKIPSHNVKIFTAEAFILRAVL